MAATFNLYTGDGVTRNFGVPFPYLDKTHVKVSLNGVLTTAFTWLTGSMIQMAVAPASLVIVDVRRVTPTGASPVDFTDGSILAESELDMLALYSAYVAAEARDYVDGAMLADTQGNWNANSRRIVSLAPGVAATDAATKGQLDATLTNISAALTVLIDTAETDLATASAAAIGGVVGAAAAASASASAASDSATAADASEAAALASQGAAAGSAGLAANYAQLALITDYGLLTGSPVINDYGTI